MVNDVAKAGSITVKWVDGLRFVAKDDAGHSIVMDAPTQSGGEGSGFSPMQLLLAALGGCTGMDVVHIMRKQRQDVHDLEVTVSGSRVKDPPRVYDNIRVEYRVEGKDIKEQAVQRAIQLSEDTYCSVGAMLEATAKVKSNYVVKRE